MTNNSREQTVLIEQVAETLIKHGVREPALALLTAGEPLAFLGAQLLWIAQPVLSLVQPATAVQQWAHLLEQPEAVRALRWRLQEEDR